MDVFDKIKRSEVMSRIRSRGNKDTEQALAKLLKKNKISGWRRHVPVRLNIDILKSRYCIKPVVIPDFIFKKERVAIFVDGCFWHGCLKHSNLPVNNRSFWIKKLEGNKCRDREVTKILRQQGWTVVRVWEHELHPPRVKREAADKKTAGRIQKALE